MRYCLSLLLLTVVCLTACTPRFPVKPEPPAIDCNGPPTRMLADPPADYRALLMWASDAIEAWAYEAQERQGQAGCIEAHRKAGVIR